MKTRDEEQGQVITGSAIERGISDGGRLAMSQTEPMYFAVKPRASRSPS